MPIVRINEPLPRRLSSRAPWRGASKPRKWPQGLNDAARYAAPKVLCGAYHPLEEKQEESAIPCPGERRGVRPSSADLRPCFCDHGSWLWQDEFHQLGKCAADLLSRM